MRIVVRNEGGLRSGYILDSPAPYNRFKQFHVLHVLGGPNLIQLPGGQWLLASRKSDVGKTTTVLGVLSRLGRSTMSLDEKVELPSGGDTSYPGLLIEDNELLVSYYSSHEGKSSIYLARVPLDLLE